LESSAAAGATAAAAAPTAPTIVLAFGAAIATTTTAFTARGRGAGVSGTGEEALQPAEQAAGFLGFFADGPRSRGADRRRFGFEFTGFAGHIAGRWAGADLAGGPEFALLGLEDRTILAALAAGFRPWLGAALERGGFPALGWALELGRGKNVELGLGGRGPLVEWEQIGRFPGGFDR
jgi:hypothetical protein